MKCFIKYQRFNADTLQGERIVVSQTYTTFDNDEMDRFEDYLINTIGMGISVEYDIDKCIKAEMESNE